MTDYIESLKNCEEIFWINPGFVSPEEEAKASGEKKEQIIDIDDAEARLLRFAPFIERMFPEVSSGIIESPLAEITGSGSLSSESDNSLCPRREGRLFVKQDSHLPISGSVKARGGIYEVLKLAEKLAVDAGLLKWDPATGEHENYAKLGDPEMKEFFSKYKVAVGSTGNLGLSIGIISAAIGFEVTVHMSADARQWKKDMLRSKGVKVVEYPDDYEAAVAQGRREAEADPTCHFVDDENSLDLFAGYSVAGRRLKRQLDDLGIKVDKDHRMYVYLPCGVGGAPGGVAYGIRETFGEGAYCFFAEPTHAPCMALGLISGKLSEIAVGDIGIDGKTEADGLAVGRPSGLVAKAMQTRLCGCFTVQDEKLYPYLAALKDETGIFIEPSACAAFEGLKYICDGRFAPKPDENSIHVIWATGGNMVPEEEKTAYYEKGKSPGQAALEAHAREALYKNNVIQKDTLNGLMKSEWGGCSYEDKTLTYEFPVLKWQANRVGNMHGGAICTAFDLTIAALARFYARENFAPTINLDVNYVRPVAMGDRLIVTAKATSTGRRITQLTAEAYIKSSGKLAATASSIYMNVDTEKERHGSSGSGESTSGSGQKPNKKSGKTGYISSLMNYSDRL